MKLEKGDRGTVYLRLREGMRDHGPDRLPEGLVEESLELDEGVYMDIDRDGLVLGVEFLSLEDLSEFLDRYPDGYEVPDRIENPAKFPPS